MSQRVLIGTVLKVHCNAVLKLEDDEAIGDDITTPDVGIHDVEEPCVGLPTF